MKKNKLCWTRLAPVAVVFAALAIFVPCAQAQQVDTNAPIVVKKQKAKPLWMKAAVIHADRNELVVHEAGNERAIHTFSYGPKAAQTIQKILNAGGYQHGDAIKIRYEAGQTVALEIKGKPSRPI